MVNFSELSNLTDCSFSSFNYALREDKKAREISLAGFLNNPGGFLLSHAVAHAVPSAPRGLTSVFGMGTGVALSTQPPENL
jgi:hypothetical protein